jgi:Tfp pilus assembly protein PilF
LLALAANDVTKGVSLLRSAAARDSWEGSYHLTLAEAYAQQGNLAAAADSYREALGCPLPSATASYIERVLSSSNYLAAVGLNRRAMALVYVGNLDAALTNLDAAISTEPSLAIAYVNRASAKSWRGDTNGASSDFRRAVELDPTLGATISRMTRRSE